MKLKKVIKILNRELREWEDELESGFTGRDKRARKTVKALKIAIKECQTAMWAEATAKDIVDNEGPSINGVIDFVVRDILDELKEEEKVRDE